jgi:dienelactone hydrolase
VRVFEVALMIANVFALLSTTVKIRTKSVLPALACINVVVLGLHGAIEGLRYQMSFAYIFAGLFAGYALIKTMKGYSSSKVAKITKGTAVSLSFLLLAITMLTSYAFPVFRLPALTGNYAVGIQYAHLTDESRQEPFLTGTAGKRELAVKIYYPATRDTTKPYSAYFHNSSKLIEAFASGYGMPAIMFSQLRLVRTHTQEGLAVSDRQAKYPVVVFSHGGGTNMELHTSQCEDLASNGYIVVAVNHTYVSSGTEFPGGIVTDRDATASFDEGDPLDAITQIMADDDNYVIDWLVDVNEGKSDSILTGKIDMEHLGVIGHSLGGAAAYRLAIHDSRIKAAVNLDGAVYTVPDKEKPAGPLLMLANDEFGIQAILKREPLMKKWEDMPADEQEAVASAYGGKQGYIDIYEKQKQAIVGLADTLKAAETFFTIDGSAHMKMTDIGLFIGPGFRRFVGINGSTSSEQCLAITKAVTLAFFDRHLRSVSGDPLESALRQYPKLNKVKLT